MQIRMDNVTFGYSSDPVLDGITLSLDGPKLIAVLGPNGVGKSTLIKCINRILSPKVGVVTIDGRDVKDYTLKEMARTVGYVPYSSSDSFPLSVVDTVLMGRHPHQRWGATDTDLAKVHEVLKKLEIEDLALRSFDELSAGQHQKVMLARGLVQEPEILLLDEPTSNLDVRHQMEVTKTLLDLVEREGITAVMICHDLNIAAKYAHELVLMFDGSIYAVGTPAEVLTEANLLRVYGVETQILEHMGRPHVILEDFVREEMPEDTDGTDCDE